MDLGNAPSGQHKRRDGLPYGFARNLIDFYSCGYLLCYESFAAALLGTRREGYDGRPGWPDVKGFIVMLSLGPICRFSYSRSLSAIISFDLDMAKSFRGLVR